MTTCDQIWNGLSQLANRMIPQPIGPIPAGPMSAPTGGTAPATDRARGDGQTADDRICQECLECDLITPAMIKSVFTRASDAKVASLADALNFNMNIGKIDSEQRISHFLGQAKQETGSNMRFEENLNYSASALLRSGIGYYAGNPARAARDAGNPQAIANNGYNDANRGPSSKLGNVNPGDGYRYRGRGLKQVTGRYNYGVFSDTHERLWGERVDFVANPDLLAEPTYAIRSGLAFWVEKGLYGIADIGVSEAVTDRITAVINRSTPSYPDRWRNVNSIWSNHTFRPVCFNTSFDLANGQAMVPFGTAGN